MLPPCSEGLIQVRSFVACLRGIPAQANVLVLRSSAAIQAPRGGRDYPVSHSTESAHNQIVRLRHPTQLLFRSALKQRCHSSPSMPCDNHRYRLHATCRERPKKTARLPNASTATTVRRR